MKLSLQIETFINELQNNLKDKFASYKIYTIPYEKLDNIFNILLHESLLLEQKVEAFEKEKAQFEKACKGLSHQYEESLKHSTQIINDLKKYNDQLQNDLKKQDENHASIVYALSSDRFDSKPIGGFHDEERQIFDDAPIGGFHDD